MRRRRRWIGDCTCATLRPPLASVTGRSGRWPTGANEPTDYWIATLDPDTPLKELVRLAKIRWRIEHDFRELKTGLGLDHFEGRSWTGWHHHATLVTAAHLFITTLRLTNPKASGQG